MNGTPHDAQPSADLLVELAHRASHGLDVTLLWDPSDERLVVVVDDARIGASFALLARDGKEALDGFHHPFVYAAADGVESSHDRHAASARVGASGRSAR